MIFCLFPRKMKKGFNNLSLQKKLIVLYIAAFIIPLLFITLYCIRGMIQISEEKIEVQNQAQCNQIAANLETRLNSLYQSVLNFSSGPVINSYFESEYPNLSSFFSVYPQVNLYITSFLVSNPQISDFVIYTDNPTFLKNASSIREITPQIQETFASLSSDTPHRLSVYAEAQQAASGVCLNLYSRISFTEDPRYQTLLFLSYSEDLLYSYYQHESDRLKLYLISPGGEIVSSDDRSLLGRRWAELPDFTAVQQTDLPDGILVQKEETHYYHTSFPESALLKGWNLYIALSDQSFLQDVRSLTAQALLLISLLSLFGLVLYCLCSLSITRRLSRLVNAMSGIRNDETLDVKLETENTDEIGILAQNFDEMLKRIKKLIIDVYTSDLQVKDLEIKNKQAELLALQSQIHPHFLFNTMQSLSISCYNNDDFETAEYINKFCSYLRDCLYWETKSVSLSEEIRVVENYLSLQKLRYQDRLDYKIQIPEKLHPIPIPKFTLQPLVENAIEHGFENKCGGNHCGMIRIWASASETTVEIVVEDNGAGIPPDKLDLLNRLLKTHSETSLTQNIGILNTNERLKLHYGPDFGLKLESAEGVGTKVTLVIRISKAPSGEKGVKNVSGSFSR